MAKVGRPSSYKPEYAERAHDLCLLGATDDDLARSFGVSDRTINTWKADFPEFLLSLNAGREVADAKVAKSLYRLALDGNVTAMIFWLKNRRKRDWRDKHEIEQTGDNAPVININLKKFEE